MMREHVFVEVFNRFIQHGKPGIQQHGGWRIVEWVQAHQWGVESKKTGNHSGFQWSRKTIGCSIIQTLQIWVGLIVWTRGEVIIESHAPIILLFCPRSKQIRFFSESDCAQLVPCLGTDNWSILKWAMLSWQLLSLLLVVYCIWCYTAWYCRDLHSWLEFSSICRMGWHGDFRQGSMHNGTPGIKISSRSLTF